jgi:hypothetical protein
MALDIGGHADAAFAEQGEDVFAHEHVRVVHEREGAHLRERVVC